MISGNTEVINDDLVLLNVFVLHFCTEFRLELSLSLLYSVTLRLSATDRSHRHQPLFVFGQHQRVPLFPIRL